MTPGADDRILPVEAQLDWVIDPTVRTDSVPNAAEMHLNLARECIFEGVFSGECRLLPFRAFGHLRVEAENIWNQLFVAGFEQSIYVQQAADCARRIGAAAETKEEDSVSVFVRIHQISVGVAHVVQQSRAAGEAHQLRPPFFKKAMGVRRSHGADTGVVIGNLLRTDRKSVVQLDDV